MRIWTVYIAFLGRSRDSRNWKKLAVEDSKADAIAALREATRDGELAIVCDASSCTEGLRQAVESDVPLAGQRPLRIVDVDDFDVSACGGTHVARTGEIGLAVVVVHVVRRRRAGTPDLSPATLPAHDSATPFGARTVGSIACCTAR